MNLACVSLLANSVAMLFHLVAKCQNGHTLVSHVPLQVDLIWSWSTCEIHVLEQVLICSNFAKYV